MFQTQVPDGTAQPISAPLTYFLMGVLHAGCLVGMAPEAHELKKHAKEHLVNKIGHIHIKEKFTSFSVNYIGFEPGNTKAPRHIWIYCCRYLLIIMVSTVTWGTLFFFDLWKYSDIFSVFTKLHFWIFSYIFIWYICIISIIPVCSIALVLLCIVWTLLFLSSHTRLSFIHLWANKQNKYRSLFSAALVKCLCCIFMQPENRAGDYKSFPNINDWGLSQQTRATWK